MDDLASKHNVPIAAFASKRVEHCANAPQLAGRPILLMLQLLIGGHGGALVH